MIDDLHIITVATESKYYFPYLIESCKKHGKELTVLGYGEKWKGFNWKLKLMILHLSTLNPDDIVCFVDGYDVICLRNLNELKDEFLKIKTNEKDCKIVIALDNLKHGFLINATVVKLSFGETSNNKLLNAGTYIGYVSDLLHVLNLILSINSNDDADDQVLMTKYCNLYDDYFIDVENKIFLTIDKPLQDISKDVKIKDGILTYSDEKPFFLHAPGSGYMDKILIQLNYNLTKNINYELFVDFFTKKYLKNTLIILIIAIVFIFLIFLIFKYLTTFRKNLQTLDK